VDAQFNYYDTNTGYQSANANVRRIDASQKALESTAKARLAKETGFKYGVETLSDVLIAQQQEFKAKKELSKAKYSYIKNRIRFMQATGLITEENLSEVNSWLQAEPEQPKQAANKS